MTIKVGDKLPEGELQEFVETETEGCSIGPNTFKVQDSTVVMDLSAFPRFSKLRSKPKVAAQDLDATESSDEEDTAAA